MKEKFNLLDTVPVRAEMVRTVWEDECVVLILPRFRKAWMQRWLRPEALSPEVRIPLEEHGTAVWKLIDGQHTVAEIIAMLQTHFAPDENYASRVAAYVVQLQRDGFIRLVVKKDDGAEV
ncbi:PqqD family peptide modification chaperone [uncultured Mediterranea sp.]|uniref:PqqD family protein n=1 Tax=uncultured Mediterranea sp. TaxID=1926662 RepID=UPI0027D9711D|nr:PqqD family peptide modification chaperone [uncultured Mediterranea sp.]